jgi:hypothetical protein
LTVEIYLLRTETKHDIGVGRQSYGIVTSGNSNAVNHKRFAGRYINIAGNLNICIKP